MNHPKHEEWVPYIFGEAKESDRRRLQDHLQECAECRHELGTWQQSLNSLDKWRLPAFTPPRVILTSFLRLAAAAVIVLTAGIGLGRLTAPRPNIERMRAAIAPQIRQELRTEFAQMLRQEMAQAEAAHAADYMTLKHDLDTVAVLTDACLRRAERQIFQLADYARPANFTK